MATCSQDQTVKLWDMTALRETAVLPHEGWVVAAAFSADGSRLATFCRHAYLHLWDVATGREQHMMIPLSKRSSSGESSLKQNATILYQIEIFYCILIEGARVEDRRRHGNRSPVARSRARLANSNAVAPTTA